MRTESAGGMGADADMEEAQGVLGAGEKMVVMLPQGKCDVCV